MTAIIRLATQADAESIQAIYAPIVRDTFISFETDIPSVQEMRERIRHKLEHYPWLVLEHAGNLLGYAYAGRWRERAAYDWSVEVTVYVHPHAQRGGVGRALYTALFEVLRLQSFVLALAGIALPNDASIGLHEAVGLQYIGTYHNAGYKFAAWHDVGWWQLQLQPPPANPVRPRAVHTLVHTPQWEAALAAGARWLRL